MSRLFTSLLAGAILAASFASTAGESYPNRPIRIVVPSAPGAASDIAVRLLAKFWQDRWKQPVVVENKPGASGLIGAESIKNAIPDGYTLGTAVSSSHASAPHVFRKLPYDPIKDFECIGLMGSAAQLALVPANSPYRSITELVSYAKANPGAVNFGYYNNLSHVTAALFKEKAKIQMEGIPYKLISQAMTDLIAGQVQLIFVDYLTASAHISGNRVIPLAITDQNRHPLLARVPALSETYPGIDVRGYIALIAPVGVPRDIIVQLNRVLREAQVSSGYKAPFEKSGAIILSSTPEECRDFMIKEIERWREFVKIAKIEPQ